MATPWLIDEGLNRLYVLVGGERVELRYTVSQHERYLELIEASKAHQKPEKATLKDNLVSTRISSLDVAHIALNPSREAKYSKADIEDKLDIDQVYLIAETWLNRKVYSPTLKQNPFLTVQEATPNQHGK